MRLVEGFYVREILGEAVAVPTGEAGRCLSGLLGMNETGKFLFELLQTEQTEETLVQELLENFEVDKQTASKDVEKIIKVLKDNQLLVNV